MDFRPKAKDFRSHSSEVSWRFSVTPFIPSPPTMASWIPPTPDKA